MLSLNKKKTIEFVFIVIISLFSIEYISFGEYLSVYRLIIFPLSIIGLVLSPPKINSENISFYVLIILALLMNIFSSLNADNGFIGMISAFGIFTFVLFVTNYIMQFGVSKHIIWIIALYSLPQYIAFFIWISDFSALNLLNASDRFNGFHKDANFLSAYINFAIVAKLYLLPVASKLKKKYLILSIPIDIVLILFSQSRVGIFVLILNFFIYLFYKNRKVLTSSLILLSIVLIYLNQRVSNINSNSDITIIDAVALRFYKTDLNEGKKSDARVKHFYNFIDIVKKNETTLIGYSLDNYLIKYHQYPHNIFIDIFLEQGLIMGSFFIIYLLYLFIKSFWLTIKRIRPPLLFHLAFSAFLGMMLLTSYKQKFFWFIVILIFLSTKRIKIALNE